MVSRLSYELFHCMVNMYFLSHGVLWMKEQGFDVSRSAGNLVRVKKLLYGILGLWSMEFILAFASKCYHLIPHHIMNLIFWPYARYNLNPYILLLSFAEIQTVPKLVFNIIPQCTGFQRCRKTEMILRLVSIIGIRVPILLYPVFYSSDLLEKIFGLAFLHYDYRTTRKILKIVYP